MAMLFDLDAERHARDAADGDTIGSDEADAAFALVTTYLAGLDPRSALRRVRRYKATFIGIEQRATSSLVSDNGNDRAVKRALNDGKTSQAAINRAAQRAVAAKENTDLADKVETGELSEEQLDVIADASARTNGAAATDTDFIDKVADVDPDQGKVLADEFVANKTTPGGTQTEHDRQRALRRGSKYHAKKRGMNAISLEGDGPATQDMWAQIQKRADELYQADGGSDLPGSRHPRTRAQLLFDAAHELLCGVTTTPTGISRTPRNGTNGAGQAPSRPQIFIGLTLDQYLGLDPAAAATQIGLGNISDSVLADYFEYADIFGVLYDSNGQPLWLGRSKRHATIMQRYALILRDKHCVLCGADHSRCDAHHRMPWTAPGKGQTNLDELVLLCRACHRRLHADNRTIFKDTGGTWRTRPATPNETPAPRAPAPRNHPQQE